MNDKQSDAMKMGNLMCKSDGGRAKGQTRKDQSRKAKLSFMKQQTNTIPSTLLPKATQQYSRSKDLEELQSVISVKQTRNRSFADTNDIWYQQGSGKPRPYVPGAFDIIQRGCLPAIIAKKDMISLELATAEEILKDA